MRPRIVVLPMAREDLRGYATYLRSESPAVSDRFLASAGTVFRLLMSRPLVGRPRAFTKPGSEGIRSIGLPDLPNHLMYYRPLPNRVEVVGVLHGAMNVRPIFGPTLRRRRR
jgi:plasmid stabilization system protein ParE